jgi:HEAT repeat protein
MEEATHHRVARAMGRLRDPRPLVRRFGARLLARLHPHSETVAAIPALRDALHDDDLWVRIDAAEALGLITDLCDDAILALLDAMAGPDAGARRLAIEAAGYIGPRARRATDVIAGFLDDPDAEMRRASAEALGCITCQTEAEIRALLTMLANRSGRRKLIGTLRSEPLHLGLRALRVRMQC